MRQPKHHIEQYSDTIARLYPELSNKKEETGNAQTHGKDRVLTRNVTFQVTDRCSLACFPKGTKILMSDLTYKNIEDVVVGDSVMSFAVPEISGKQITLVPTTVTHNFIRHDYLRTIVDDNGVAIQTTDEHPFYNGRRKWVRAEDINNTMLLYKFESNMYSTDITDYQYMLGYVVGAWLGDGTLCYHKNGEVRSESDIKSHNSRFVVKDNEINNRLCYYLDELNIKYYRKPFDGMPYDAIWVQGRALNKQLFDIIESNIGKNVFENYYKGFMAGIIDTEGNSDNNIRIVNTSTRILDEIIRCCRGLNIEYSVANCGGTKNYDNKFIITLLGKMSNFVQMFRMAVPRKGLEKILNHSFVERVKIKDNIKTDVYSEVYNFETENHHYIANNFLVHNCTYCYQINKGKRRMSFDVAKRFVDLLLSGEKGFSDYVGKDFSPAIVLEFIGGEPFLEVELIDQVCDYFMDRAIELHHPWAKNFMISICSNGVAYFEPKVQAFLEKWKNRLSFSITIDGDKELHDSCRVFPDGSPSYDIAIAGAKDWMSRGYYMGSKITIATGNIDYLSRAIKHMIQLGYDDINCNCVYEKGWEIEHATKLYNELKSISDYLFDNNLEDEIYISILSEDMFKPKDVDDLASWCWGKDTPILTADGYKPIQDVKIGDLVYTPNGNLKPVINTMSHMADNCVEIQASGVLPMVCTKDHRLFAQPFNYRGWLNKPHYKEYGVYSIEEIIDTKTPTRSRVKLGVLPNNRNVSVDKGVAYLLGRTIGDGWCSPNTPAVCCGKSELQELIRCFDNANIAYRMTESKTTYDFYATKQLNDNNENYELYCKLCADIGKGACNKHIPSECFTWDNDSLEALLQGFISADGYINNKRQKYRIKTSSERLANDLLLIARTVGYNPLCDTPLYVKGNKEMLCGREITRNGNIYCLSWSFEKHSGKYYYEDSNGMFTSRIKVRDVEPQEVYNLTVADEHCYIAGSLASKNCGGLGDMLAVDPDGWLYPCLRYMESSLGTDQKAVRIGNVYEGLCQKEEEKCLLCDMCAVTRRTYNTDECFYCPIADGCADCAAYNYQVNGTFNQRAIFICEMHKARCLANAYYWGKYYEKHEPEKKFKLYMPDDWSIKIIGEDELNMIKSLPNVELCQTTWEEVKAEKEKTNIV